MMRCSLEEEGGGGGGGIHKGADKVFNDNDVIKCNKIGE